MNYFRQHKMQLSPSVRRFLSLAWAVIEGFFWPVAIALAIVAWGAFAPWQPSDDTKDKIKAFFAILFFIMFFFGQYKRVEKQTDDKDSFKSVNEQLLSLQELVRKIRPAARAEAAVSRRFIVGDAGTLLDESRALLQAGHTLAALLQGGVAFEHALRAFARHFKGEESAGLPLHELIRRMAPQEMLGELHALRQIRNRLTHISETELSDLPDANRVLDGYQWAVAELGKIVKRDHAA
jgi:hypothetical protein